MQSSSHIINNNPTPVILRDDNDDDDDNLRRVEHCLWMTLHVWMVGASLVGKDGGEDLVQQESTAVADSSRQFTLLLPAFSDQEQQHVLSLPISPNFPYQLPRPEAPPPGVKTCECGEQLSNCGGLYALHQCLHRPQPLPTAGRCDREFSRSLNLHQHRACQQSTAGDGHPPNGGILDRKSPPGRNRRVPPRHKSDRSSPGLAYSCELCRKQFRSNSHLTRHRQVHTGERPHQCAVCEKRFSEPSSLKRHMYIHTNEAPHACPTCGHRYASPCYLREHMLSHSGERPNKCPICEKQYSRAGHLTRHLRQHARCREERHRCDSSRSEMRNGADDGENSQPPGGTL